MVKLIITDMDGTLLNEQGEIPTEFWELEKKLAKNGIIFSVASGRPYYNLVEKFKDIKDNMMFIAENGACVMYQDKEIFSNTIEREDVFFLLNICKKIKGAIPILCGKNSAYVEKESFFNEDFDFKPEIEKYYNKLQIVDTFNSVQDEFLKIAICDFLDSEKNSYHYFKELEDKFKIVISGKVWLDLAKIDTNKGLAIEMIQKKLGISFDETMAFGDYLNDYEMMKTAKYSYAMKNAHPKLKEISNFVTKEDNTKNGVLKTIEEYFINL